jgi:VIT1/CCC1 family predicted Fe2+/Mn2+ transporter
LNDYDHFPDGTWPAQDVPYGRYHDPRSAPPNGRHRDTGEPGYAPSGVNVTIPRLRTDGWPVQGGPPRNDGGNGHGWGYPPSASGPQPAYWAPNGRAAAGYSPPRGGRPMGPYPPGTGPMRAYRPGSSGPMPAYRPDNSGPRPAYRAPNGRPASGRTRAGTSLLAPPGPADASPLSGGRQILGWLPFGNRLVLLPKDVEFDHADSDLREHRDVNGGALRPAVFGAMDGLVTNSSLIAGIGGGGGGHGMIVLTGIAGLIAGAFSMATGEYISVKSQNELTEAEIELERKQHARDPVGKLARLAEVFVEKGVSPNLAEAVVRQISADRERAVATHVREDLGIDPDDLPSPRTAAVASFASFTVGALIPLSPFLVGYPVLNAALVIAGATAFVGGAALAKITGRSMVLGGLRQFAAAFMATGMAFLVGHLISGHIS